MLKGIVFALTACLIWGLIFVIPGFMTGFNALEVAIGRFIFFGLFSIVILLRVKNRYPPAIWAKAIYYSLFSTMGYYIFLVLALRFATPAICALVLGISPIAIAFYGNWKQREVPFKSLILPSLLILVGLIIINFPHLKGSSSFLLGLGCITVSLVSWSWFVVANSRFLNRHPEVKSHDWSTLIGIGAFIWALIALLILKLFFEDQIPMEKYLTPGRERQMFFIGAAILGILCSWGGGFLWNRACLRLPVSLAGQLTIFETIFGVLFVYLIEGRFPLLSEGIGIAILLGAVSYGVRKFNNAALS